MKLHNLFSSKTTTASEAAHKAIQTRGSAAKHATHRYERRKIREFLRQGTDVEDESSRFERFG